jgi:hypothetical protein
MKYLSWFHKIDHHGLRRKNKSYRNVAEAGGVRGFVAADFFPSHSSCPPAETGHAESSHTTLNAATVLSSSLETEPGIGEISGKI